MAQALHTAGDPLRGQKGVGMLSVASKLAFMAAVNIFRVSLERPRITRLGWKSKGTSEGWGDWLYNSLCSRVRPGSLNF